MEICKILINKIEKLCDTNNITTNQMLLKCGLAKDVVNNMKKEKPSIPSVDKIYAIAQYFNVSSDYLLGLDDISNRKKETAAPDLTGAEKRLLIAFKELTHDEQMAEVGRVELLAEQAIKAKNSEAV